MKVDIVDVCTYVDVLNPNWPQFCLHDPLAQDVSSWYELYDSVMISGYYAGLILNPKVSLTLRVTVITFNQRRIQYAAAEETFVSTYPGASLGVTTTLFVSEC